MSVYRLAPVDDHTWWFARDIVLRDSPIADDEPVDPLLEMWTPAIYGDQVYVADTARILHGYDLRSGKKINEVNFAKWILHRYFEDDELEEDEEYVPFFFSAAQIDCGAGSD